MDGKGRKTQNESCETEFAEKAIFSLGLVWNILKHLVPDFVSSYFKEWLVGDFIKQKIPRGISLGSIPVWHSPGFWLNDAILGLEMLLNALDLAHFATIWNSTKQ